MNIAFALFLEPACIIIYNNKCEKIKPVYYIRFPQMSRPVPRHLYLLSPLTHSPWIVPFPSFLPSSDRIHPRTHFTARRCVSSQKINSNRGAASQPSWSTDGQTSSVYWLHTIGQNETFYLTKTAGNAAHGSDKQLIFFCKAFYSH